MAEIGTAANLAEVFGVEGAIELSESAFSTEGLSSTSAVIFTIDKVSP